MKKFILGFVVGGLIFSGASAFAASALVGQKVQGTYEIKKGSKKVADAVIINGSAYAPVRAVAESTGTNLTIEGKTIIMGDVNYSNIDELNFQKSVLERKIKENQGGIHTYESDIIPRSQKNYDNSIGTDEEESRKQALDARNAELDKLKQDLSKLQSELDELDSKIKELQK